MGEAQRILTWHKSHSGAEPGSEPEGPASQVEVIQLLPDDFLCNHLPIVYSEQEQGELDFHDFYS